MGFFGHSPTRRAIGLACALAWYMPAADLAAGTLEQADSPGAPQLSQPSAEPFGLSVSRVFAGPLREKWRKVERNLDDERVQIALCDGDRERCASPAALRFLAIVDSARGREGRARLGEVNRAVNLATRRNTARRTSGRRRWSRSATAPAIAKITPSPSSLRCIRPEYHPMICGS